MAKPKAAPPYQFVVEQMSVADIKPYEKNPRHNAAAIQATAKSIREFGWRQPIVVDESSEIVVGHTRYIAALTMGMREVPVHVAKGLTADQVKAYRIMDNRSGELADWDFGMLADEFQELDQANFDTDLTGFDWADISTGRAVHMQ